MGLPEVPHEMQQRSCICTGYMLLGDGWLGASSATPTKMQPNVGTGNVALTPSRINRQPTQNCSFSRQGKADKANLGQIDHDVLVGLARSPRCEPELERQRQDSLLGWSIKGGLARDSRRRDHPHQTVLPYPTTEHHHREHYRGPVIQQHHLRVGPTIHGCRSWSKQGCIPLHPPARNGAGPFHLALIALRCDQSGQGKRKLVSNPALACPVARR
ncbi:hypothetical protein B0T19DRAFT_16151 [Cercophora scortea]|uniref:Uncharacterized protein n=1 Tax=Cercophora scortea TaxID=314031 RepID=A0AAE0J2H7_9PEZI|nr:hypothetical protein B0T19DRAFT_16151 [Cercophora scortea]